MYRGSKNPAFKGGTAIYGNGQGHSYRYIRGQSQRIAEHRYVMEQHLGRQLKPSEEVHHLNGDKLDNHIVNLVIVPKQTHSRNHFALTKQIQQLELENRILKEQLALLS